MRVRQVVRHVSAGLDTPAGVTTFLWDEQGKTELPPWLSRDLEKEMHTHARSGCNIFKKAALVGGYSGVTIPYPSCVMIYRKTMKKE
eukprot:scaffold145146_cov18-Tisochrysis_lutea.AAC.1